MTQKLKRELFKVYPDAKWALRDLTFVNRAFTLKTHSDTLNGGYLNKKQITETFI